MTYGYCAYHERECDYEGYCADCPRNTVEDAEWFKQDEEREESRCKKWPEQWRELKETIVEMRDNNGTATQQEVCKFLVNLMDVLEKQTQESKTTNGDVIKAMFPNCEQKEHMNNGYFEMYFDGNPVNASYMRVSKAWWDAPYETESEE